MVEVDENLCLEHELKSEYDELYEVYGNNGNQLYSAEIVLDLKLEPIVAQNWVFEKLAKAKLSGKLTGVVAGAFDMPQENHEWYLRHSRLLLAKRYLQKNNLEINAESLRYTIESDNIFLVVSIDSDTALDNRKSGDATKGGARRPIYGWKTRANRVASHNVASTVNHSERYGIVDLVIAEGPEYKGTALERAKIFADIAHNEYGLIDEYIVFDEHPADIANAIKSNFDPLIIPMSMIYSYDPLTNKPYKSSNIIKRVRGED